MSSETGRLGPRRCGGAGQDTQPCLSFRIHESPTVPLTWLADICETAPISMESQYSSWRMWLLTWEEKEPQFLGHYRAQLQSSGRGREVICLVLDFLLLHLWKVRYTGLRDSADSIDSFPYALSMTLFSSWSTLLPPPDMSQQQLSLYQDVSVSYFPPVQLEARVQSFRKYLSRGEGASSSCAEPASVQDLGYWCGAYLTLLCLLLSHQF